LHQSDAALEQLRAVLAQKPARPAGTMAAAYLALGESEDRLGHRDAAVAAYRLAVTHSIADDPEDTRKRASDRIKKTPDAAAAEAYRLSLDGLRKFEKGDIASAESALARSLSIDPRQPVARYRYAHVLLSKKDDAGALAQLEVVIRSARDCPAPIAASAYYEAARIHERLAHRDKAIEYYRAASAGFGGAAETRASAGRALQRLRAPQ
jgi:tetratricopeptide (TPR) repeat protein